MKSNTSSVVSLVLVLMAASSLVSMISTLKIDSIVHGDLYRYGLQFSYRWAMPYWTLTTIVFGMGWFNIVIAIAFQFYVLMYGRKEAVRSEISTQAQTPSQPVREEIIEVETKPSEKGEEYKEQVTEPPEKEVEKEPEETQPLVEATSQQEQLETEQVEEVEGKKEQESKSTEESQTEPEETSTSPTETEQKTPVLPRVPEEESQTTIEDTPQQFEGSQS